MPRNKVELPTMWSPSPFWTRRDASMKHWNPRSPMTFCSSSTGHGAWSQV